MKKTFLHAVVSAALAASPIASGAEIHWSYEGEAGPAHWGELSPDFHLCKDGTRQSPIDVRPNAEQRLPKMWFSYAGTPLRVINNGHTIQVNYQADSYLMVGNDKYKLLQFHFHTPSEHLLKGRSAPMEVHFVHINTSGQLAVVGVMMHEGDRANPTIQKIWDHAPKTEGEVDVEGASLNALNLLPGNLKEYANYAGSLTTPPCSEGVRWFVMEESIKLSREQIETFRALFELNARPVQALNGRKVLENKD